MTAAAVDVGGLVPLSTSATHLKNSAFSNQEIEVDTRLARWKKLRKSIREAARLHEQEMAATRARWYRSMLTLTYSPENEPEPKDITALLKAIGQWSKRRKIHLRYCWVAELQTRGALHYHILFWVPKGISLPKPDKQGWWRWGSTNIKAVTSPIGYVTKYASKIRQKLKAGSSYPKGFRTHGCGGLTRSGREERSFLMRPNWLQELGTPEMKIRPAKGGGYFSRETGEHWSSPWRILHRFFRPGQGWIVTLIKE